MISMKILGNTTIHKHDLLPAQYTGSVKHINTMAFNQNKSFNLDTECHMTYLLKGEIWHL